MHERSWGSRRRWTIAIRRGGTALALAVAGVLVWSTFAVGTQPYETYESAVTASGPAAQFRFDDATGSSKVVDSVGSYTATNSGIALGKEGPFGGSKSGSFGGEAYATLPGDPLEGTKEWTAEAWVDWAGGTSFKQPVFDFGSSSTNYVYLTPASSLTGHKLLLEIHTSGGSSAQVTAAKLGASAWHYLAVTETTSGTLTLYEDGEKVGQTTGASVSPSSLGATPTDYLGKSLVSGEPNFDGSLSNVAFYRKALSASQIQTHWDDAEFPVNISPPTITGTPKDGDTLTVKAGTWTGLSPITFDYEWQRCNEHGESCTGIAGATETKYTAGHGDVGSTLRVAVTAANATPIVGTATTAHTTVVEAVPPSNTALPSISGEAKDGQLLSANNGTWEGTPPLSYSYQWEVCASGKCKKIAGATASSYRVITSEIGEKLRLTVTAENTAGSKSAKSTETATVVAGKPVNVSLPTISGTAEEGDVLVASRGEWAGTPPIVYTYQWQRCAASGEECISIAGATTTSYELRNDENLRSTLRVVVTAANAV